MPNGDTLKVNPDGTYELKTEDGKVKTDEYSGGSKAHQLTYPNGDTINFGNDPTTRKGRIFSVIRDGFFLGMERAADSDRVPVPILSLRMVLGKLISHFTLRQHRTGTKAYDNR